MVPIKQHEQNADGRWKQEKTGLDKRVGMDHSAAIMNANRVHGLLVISIQRRKVDI